MMRGRVLFVVDGEVVEGDGEELLKFAVLGVEFALSSYDFLCLLEVVEGEVKLF